jgi:hypothetical protein
VESLFQIRRCSDALAPSLDHPGCIYGEMNQCLRPCQAAVTSVEYASELERVSEFLSDNGTSITSGLTVARDRAAQETEFEMAAQLHKRIEKVKTVAALRPEAIAPLNQFGGVAVTRGSRPYQLRLWPMTEGYWQDPLNLDVPREASSSKSLDGQLRELLTEASSKLVNYGDRIDDLAVFVRWFHSSWRDGEWVPFATVSELNYRKLVRAVSRIASQGQ